VGLARVAGLPPLENPAQQMVAAKLRQGQFGGLTTYEDSTQRISELGREALNEVLLVYYYSNPEEGPGGRGGDNKKVLVFHRTAGVRGADGKFSAPLLLWLPPSETYDPQLHVHKLGGSSTQQQQGSGGGRLLGGADVEYALTEEAPLWQHVSRMMQPFLAPPGLWQQPAGQEAAAEVGSTVGAAADSSPGVTAEQPKVQQEETEADAEQQQPAASAGPADVSMAAASALPASSAASPSPEPCCTSQPASSAAAPAAAAAAAGACAAGGSGGAAFGGAWGSDGGVANNKAAASEAGDNNSTWGSHGSDLAHSDMDIGDLGCDETVDDEAVGISRAASQQQLAADDAEAATPGAAAAAAAAGGAADMESGGELDASAALAAQQLGPGSERHSSPAAGGDGAGGGGGVGVGVLGSGGVQVEPLDIWAAQSQVRSMVGDTGDTQGDSVQQKHGHQSGVLHSGACCRVHGAIFFELV